ncbi:Hsp20/alpha crystallin family protein [Natrarchaeobius sp. A-rgal3]|uniref:Hsp20/alpha crystallin family protein n=1 Tax=Natrarchaeobius versutus TaxID=1679078 RepID=UPI00350F31F4
MTDDDHDPDDRPGGSDDETERNRADGDDDHWLESLLSALEGLEDLSTSERRRSGRSVFDVDLSVRRGDDVVDDEPRPKRGSLAGDRPTGTPRDPHDHESRRKRTRTRSSSRPSVATRRYEDELLVTADVGDADADDVTVGFEGAALVVGLAGRELDRVEVPWTDHTAEAGIRNGVLTVRVEPRSGEETGDREDAEAGETAGEGTDDTGDDETDGVGIDGADNAGGDGTDDTEVDDE